MAKVRYVKDLSKTGSTGGVGSASMRTSVRTFRAIYETEPEIAAAVLPKPLVLTEPKIFVQFAHVIMHVSDTHKIEIGAATVGVASEAEGVKGWYVLSMPMEGEFVVITGREIFGEPKKIGKVDFDVADGKIKVAVTRNGFKFIEMEGTIGESMGPAEFTENFFCYKGMPAITRRGGFDGPVFLTQLDWERKYTDMKKVTGTIKLNESPFDPIADVPVKKVLEMAYCEGGSITSGKILREVPPEWLDAFWHQRFDEPTVQGLEVPLESEKKVANA
ncbi:acetoacetate decarboxylase family protein [Zavarzinia sp.]|uniref:acetoacetate decarboxylase family protein n=1 Tax=Zavarzinia sp. TaxID=2027920 RepID=UPI0035626E97